MNRDHISKKFNGHIYKGCRLTDIYSRGRLLYRDREIKLVKYSSQGRHTIKLSENILRDAMEQMENYIHSLPPVSNIQELKNRVEAGLRVPSQLAKAPLDADTIISLLGGKVYNGQCPDFRPDACKASCYTEPE
ncbi:MAG: hypothetical protein ACLFR0_01600 [Alphaproteobacteria bacterium]